MEELASSDGFFLITLSLQVDAVADYSVQHRPCRRPALQKLEVLFKKVLETFRGALHWKEYFTGRACLGGAWSGSKTLPPLLSGFPGSHEVRSLCSLLFTTSHVRSTQWTHVTVH